MKFTGFVLLFRYLRLNDFSEDTMKNNAFPGLVGITGLFILLFQGLNPPSAYAQPNVVFILADDLGWSQTSAYGSQYYKTPNIDRIASEGVRFTDAYSAAAICSPTRAAILTGKSPARLHLTDYIPGATHANAVLRVPAWQKFLPLEETTLAEVFRDEGYHTALFGKWHLSPEKFGPRAAPFYPDKQGFQEFFVIDKPEKGDDPEGDPHKSDSIGTRAVRFIRQNASTPFFLFLAFSAIHNPLMARSDDIAHWQKSVGSDTATRNPIIAAMLSRMDRNIGHVLAVLDELRLARNTVVIFYSDNGGLASDASQAPLRAGKGHLYEGGIRVPLLIRWTGVIREGRVSGQLVSSCDFMPTFCELLSVPSPESIDGISLLPLLRDEKVHEERTLFWHYPHYHSVGMRPGGAMRSGRWKLIENFEKSLTGDAASAFELYDLKNDFGEQRDLSTRHPEVVLTLSKKLETWRRDVGAQLPVASVDAKY